MCDYPNVGNEILTFNYLGYSTDIPIDIFSPQHFINLLIKAGIDREDIIAVYAKATRSRLEVFLAYHGEIKNPRGRADFGFINSLKIPPGYGANNAFIAPYSKLIADEVIALAENLSFEYEINSFMIRNKAVPSIPLRALLFQVRDGVLADMRNIPYSYLLVQLFKDLNWGRIWYMDENLQQKAVVRPITGWPKN